VLQEIVHCTLIDDVDSLDTARLSPMIEREEDTTCTGRASVERPTPCPVKEGHQ
jgi:hypothetical protein